MTDVTTETDPAASTPEHPPGADLHLGGQAWAYPALEPLLVPITQAPTPHPGNPKRGDVQSVMESMRLNGIYRPIYYDQTTGHTLGGHTTTEAITALGATRLPVLGIQPDTLTALRILEADNATAEAGTYDVHAQIALLERVLAEQGDLTGTGRDETYLNDLAASLEAINSVPDERDPDAVPALPVDAVTAKGDVWVLGPHRIMCGDCRDSKHIAQLIDGGVVNLAFTSPPYASQRTYDPESGFQPIHPDQYVEWFAAVAANVVSVLADDGSWLVNIKAHAEGGQRHLYVNDLVSRHVRGWGWRFVDEFAWVRPTPPGRWPDRFKNGWESVFHFARNAPKFRPDALATPSDSIPLRSSEVGANLAGPNGAYWNLSSQTEKGLALPSNVVNISGVETGTGHQAAFPVGLPTWFILALTDPGDVVFDPFVGSGSSLIAAHRSDRLALGMEISPRYVDVTCKRYQEHTGIMPTRNGEPHDFTT